MLTADGVISDSLSPAVAISGILLFVFGLNNRIISVGSRIRSLNQELREGDSPMRLASVRQQIPLMMLRATLIRNAVFLLLGAVAMLILAAAAIALTRLGALKWEIVSIWSFVAGLFFILLAVSVEVFEVIINLRALNMDVSNSFEIANASGTLPESEAS